MSTAKKKLVFAVAAATTIWAMTQSGLAQNDPAQLPGGVTKSTTSEKAAAAMTTAPRKQVPFPATKASTPDGNAPSGVDNGTPAPTK